MFSSYLAPICNHYSCDLQKNNTSLPNAIEKQALPLFGGRQMDRGFHLTADGLGKTRKRLQRGTMNVNLPLYKKQLPGLEEAGVNPGYAVA